MCDLFERNSDDNYPKCIYQDTLISTTERYRAIWSSVSVVVIKLTIIFYIKIVKIPGSRVSISRLFLLWTSKDSSMSHFLEQDLKCFACVPKTLSLVLL